MPCEGFLHVFTIECVVLLAFCNAYQPIHHRSLGGSVGGVGNQKPSLKPEAPEFQSGASGGGEEEKGSSTC
jgi:hypothetical protein